MAKGLAITAAEWRGAIVNSVTDPTKYVKTAIKPAS